MNERKSQESALHHTGRVATLLSELRKKSETRSQTMCPPKREAELLKSMTRMQTGKKIQHDNGRAALSKEETVPKLGERFEKSRR